MYPTLKDRPWHGSLRTVGLTVIALSIAGCTTVTPRASAVGSPEIVCDNATWEPTASLTCGAAVASAMEVLSPGQSPVVREEFHWGILCPPSVPCSPPSGDSGYV